MCVGLTARALIGCVLALMRFKMMARTDIQRALLSAALIQNDFAQTFSARSYRLRADIRAY